MNEHSRKRSVSPWWSTPTVLKTIGTSAFTLIVGALLVGWHVQNAGQATPVTHKASGDLLYFGVLGIVVVLATMLIVARQRRSISDDEAGP
jgi:polyferredoxin